MKQFAQLHSEFLHDGLLQRFLSLPLHIAAPATLPHVLGHHLEDVADGIADEPVHPAVPAAQRDVHVDVAQRHRDDRADRPGRDGAVLADVDLDGHVQAAHRVLDAHLGAARGRGADLLPPDLLLSLGTSVHVAADPRPADGGLDAELGGALREGHVQVADVVGGQAVDGDVGDGGGHSALLFARAGQDEWVGAPVDVAAESLQQLLETVVEGLRLAEVTVGLLGGGSCSQQQHQQDAGRSQHVCSLSVCVGEMWLGGAPSLN